MTEEELQRQERAQANLKLLSDTHARELMRLALEVVEYAVRRECANIAKYKRPYGEGLKPKQYIQGREDAAAEIFATLRKETK